MANFDMDVDMDINMDINMAFSQEDDAIVAKMAQDMAASQPEQGQHYPLSFAEQAQTAQQSAFCSYQGIPGVSQALLPTAPDQVPSIVHNQFNNYGQQTIQMMQQPYLPVQYQAPGQQPWSIFPGQYTQQVVEPDALASHHQHQDPEGLAFQARAFLKAAKADDGCSHYHADLRVVQARVALCSHLWDHPKHRYPCHSVGPIATDKAIKEYLKGNTADAKYYYYRQASKNTNQRQKRDKPKAHAEKERGEGTEVNGLSLASSSRTKMAADRALSDYNILQRKPDHQQVDLPRQEWRVQWLP